MNKKQVTVFILLFLALSCVGGCFSARKKNIEAFMKPHQVVVTNTDYKLCPPDEIEIHCTKVPEIDMQLQQIRPDGKVSFEGLGEIDVAGKTPNEVAEIVKRKASELYALKGDYPVDVRIVGYSSKVYYVAGEVARPGPMLHSGREDVLTAVAKANIEITAWEEHIQVIRPSMDEKVKPKVFELNLKHMIIHGDTSKNVLLEPGDIIYVPPTPLAALGNVIAEFVRPIGLALTPALTATRITNGGSGF